MPEISPSNGNRRLSPINCAVQSPTCPMQCPPSSSFVHRINKTAAMAGSDPEMHTHWTEDVRTAQCPTQEM